MFRFNVIDLLVLAYVVYGAIRGRYRGFGRELPKATGAVVAFVTGCGFYRWTDRLLAGVSHMTGQTAGPLGFVGVLVVSYVLVQRLKGRICKWAEEKVPDEKMQKRAGAIAGAARTVIIASAIILFVSHLPIGPLRAPFKDGSLLGRTLNRVILPVYEASRQ